MEQQSIAWLVLGIMTVQGLLFIASALWVAERTKRRNESCTAQTTGRVVRHAFRGEGRMFPIVEFTAAGQQYESRKRFEYIKLVRFGGLNGLLIHPNASETPDGKLYLRLGAFVNYRALAEELWPIGSQMAVYFNPENPRINYADRPIRNRFLQRVFLSAGVLLIATDIVLFALI